MDLFPAVDELGWFAIVLQDEGEALEPLQSALTTLLLISLSALGAALVIAWFVARSFIQPLRRLTDAAVRIGQNQDWSARVAIRGRTNR